MPSSSEYMNRYTDSDMARQNMACTPIASYRKGLYRINFFFEKIDTKAQNPTAQSQKNPITSLIIYFL